MEHSEPVVIEIHGTGTHNRGAELMAIAIADRMKQTFPECRLVVPQKFGDYRSRAELGLWTTLEESRRLRSGLLNPIIQHSPEPMAYTAHLVNESISSLIEPNRRARQALGIISPDEIDVVLDASGFAFSDQWGPAAARRLMMKMRYRRRGRPLVLLPQAYGPFGNRDVAIWTKRLLERAELIFARDHESHRACVQLLGDSARIHQFPDFTLTVEPRADEKIQLPEFFSAIVPNRRMVDKGIGRNGYLRFLKESYLRLESLHLNPLFVIHDSKEDLTVLSELQRDGLHFETRTSRDPRVLKWILGRASVVIASRFHALVSAMSQGVPCIGAGWSHKYAQLFESFGCSNLLVDSLDRMECLHQPLELLSDPVQRETVSKQLVKHAADLKVQSEQMWKLVEQTIRQQIESRYCTTSPVH
jgi:polysaccharide pyruvyl transferase WcaK-like protein